MWLQVDLSAVSLFCLTEVIPLRHSSFCFPPFLPEVKWVTSSASIVVHILGNSKWFYKAASTNYSQMVTVNSWLTARISEIYTLIKFLLMSLEYRVLVS